MNEDTNEDLQPLFGAVGPYLSTGPTNPVEDDEDDEPYPADYYDAPDTDGTDFWEDDEQ